MLVYLIYLKRYSERRRSEIHIKIQDHNELANLREAEIARQHTAIESFREKIINFAQLKGVTEKLSQCLTCEDTSNTLSAEVNSLFGDKTTTIILYLFHSRTGELGLSSSKKGQMRVNLKSKKGDLFDQWVVRTMQPLLVENIKNDYRFDQERILSLDSRLIYSLISVPLMVGNKALGILRIDSPEPNHFTTEDLRFLTTVGDIGAVAIENAQLYERIEQLAIKDGLTGLYLRQYLLDRIPSEISRQIRRKSSFGLLMLDLDHFKQYNDKFGHVAGDIVLREVGKILSEFFSEAGMLVCRYGGEEFTVLLPDCTQKQAFDYAEKVRRKIAQHVVSLRREQTSVTVSVGVAVFPENAQNTIELVHKADLALYQAKEQGRNRVCLAT